MSLEFKKIEVNSIQEMLPFYAMRHNMTCDSVFLESYVWKDYYNVRYAIWENKALLWLMENEGRCFSAMPLCRIPHRCQNSILDSFNSICRFQHEYTAHIFSF